MNKIITSVLVAACVFASSLAFCADDAVKEEAAGTIEQSTSIETDNPIEKAFAKDFEIAMATSEISLLAETYSDAWKAELKVVSDKIKKMYTNKDDIKRVDDYLAGYEKLISIAFDLEMLNWIDDTSKPVAERNFGTGGPGAAMMAQGKLYKQATLNLVAHCNAANPEAAYAFSYNGKGADLETLRKQAGE